MNEEMKQLAAAFGAKSTTEDVLAGIDLKNKRYLITGVSSGMGIEIARSLVAHGAEVVGTARNLAKAEEATGQVRTAAETSSGSFDVIALDLADLESVRTSADKLVADGGAFDAIIANAGIMATPFERTRDGFENQFATNYLGHFLFVNRIASLIREGGRLVTVSSNGHRWADIDLEDPNFEKRAYDPWDSYGAAKTAVVLFAVEFDRRYRDRGIRATSLMPGVANTGLGQHLTQEDLAALIERTERENAAADLPPSEFKTIPQVAATSVWAAVAADGDEIGGHYCQDCQVVPIDDTPGLRSAVMSYAVDPERAKLLWTKSEELVGEHF
ncbi:SDR family NAD(P)-dependent oxidoreductase [Saccharibacillus sp. CPCC 101409]|uniref:SDR family NAD(P)-dependent oxidoreductase n=1 Tax=Saccharibacillus sp. CPCC 101409 TaxID=3058041 RepID=UPI002671A486|nr:SDR family NAD(P)-dependent oxidoreductase [Saccharibacillus sp. CPCC 101409]MDO3408246.1 SDR family NAD(P)-dependent oxidoreductase [Saccharibacillus sp. CPCC 101409]